MRYFSMRQLGKWIWIIGLFMLLSACSSANQKRFEASPYDYGTRNVSDEDQKIRSQPPDEMKQLSVNHQNEKLAYSQSDSDKIAAMAGVRDAVVMLSDKNAYVAVILDRTATGVQGEGTRQYSDRTIGSGQYHVRSNNSRTQPPNIMHTGDNSFDTMPNHEDLSSELSQQVRTILKQTHSDVQNVFISSNQQFVNQMSQYAHEAWRQKSLEPYLGDFNTLMKSYFQPSNLNGNKK